MSYHFRIDRLFHIDSVGIWIIKKGYGQTSVIANPCDLVFTPVPETFRLPEPTLNLNREDALDFIKAFLEAIDESQWFQSKKVNNDKEVLAIKEHLNDMRKMTDKLLELVKDK